MTNDNKRTNIAIEVERGARSMRSAEILLAAGELADAVSRAYYAAFHHARALLLTLGEEAQTHRGVVSLLYRDLVRAGKLSPDIARLLGELQRFRQDADYSAEFVFTESHATAEVDNARTFIAEATAILRRDGWLA